MKTVIGSMESLGMDNFRVAYTRFLAFYSDNPSGLHDGETPVKWQSKASWGNAGNGRGVRTCTSVLRAFDVLFFAIRCLLKGKIDPNLLRRTRFRPRKKKSKEANRSTSTSEAEDEVLTAL